MERLTWTEERLALLRTLAEGGVSAQRIGIRLKVSATAVSKKAVELGVKVKRIRDTRETYGLKRSFWQNTDQANE